jgi:hypothetical protein
MNDSLSQQEIDELLSDMSQQHLLTQELAKMKQGESSIILLGCGHIHSTYDVFRSTTTTRELITSEASHPWLLVVVLFDIVFLHFLLIV